MEDRKGLSLSLPSNTEKALGSEIWRKVITFICLTVILVALFGPPWPFLNKADLIGYAICHRIPERSFFMAGRQLPLCARCSGTYLGAMLGLTSMWVLGRRRAAGLPPKGIMAVLAAFIFALAVDGLNSYLTFFPNAPHLYEPHNILRLTTGSLNGLALSFIVFPLFNFTLWQKVKPEPVLQNFRELIFVLVADAVIIFAVQSQFDILLYPIAFISSAGVLVMLTLVNTMIVLIVIRRENVASSWEQALPFMLMGGVVTLFEIGAMALFRSFMAVKMGFPL